MSRRCETLVAGAALFTLLGCGARTPTAELAGELLSALDTAVAQGSTNAYDALFAQRGGAGFGGSRDARMRHLLEQGARLAAVSSVQEFRQSRGIGVALAETVVDTGDADHCEHSYLAFRTDAGTPLALLHVDVDAAMRDGITNGFTGAFRCPACNYTIGSPTSDWLVVPSPRAISGCTEMVSFYPLDDDLRLSITVARNPGSLDAQSLLQQLLHDETPAQPPRPWPLPAALAAVGGARGASAQLDRTSQRTTLYCITHPAGKRAAPSAEIAYLLTVDGDPDAHRRRATEIQLWLASFRLLDPEIPADEVGRRAAAAHSGGAVRGQGAYHNERYGLHCRGPAEFHAYGAADVGLCHVSYVCPDDTGTIGITAYSRTAATLDGERAAIEASLAARLRALGQPLRAAPQWQPKPDPNPWEATAVLRYAAGDAGSGHRGAALLYDDLWVLVDAEVRDEALLEPFAAVLGSVRRRAR